jgi:hypothetical protein
MNVQSASVIRSVHEKLPSGSAPKDMEKFNVYWPQFDRNKNGYLSMSEVDHGMRYVIKLPELFPLAPVIKRAFNASKAKMKAMTKFGDDYVSKA